MIQLLLTKIELNGIKLMGRSGGTELGLTGAAEKLDPLGKLPCFWTIAVVSQVGLGTVVVSHHVV